MKVTSEVNNILVKAYEEALTQEAKRRAELFSE